MSGAPVDSRFVSQPALHTRRLLLRPLQAADAPRVQACVAREEVHRHLLAVPSPYPADGAATWIAGRADAFAAGTSADFAIVLAENDLLVGAIGIRPELAHARAEIGYWIAPEERGRGYASEAAWAVVRYGFEVLNLHRIAAYHDVANPASGRVMEKIGMRYEGFERGAVRLRDGTHADIGRFAILRTDEAYAT